MLVLLTEQTAYSDVVHESLNQNASESILTLTQNQQFQHFTLFGLVCLRKNIWINNAAHPLSALNDFLQPIHYSLIVVQVHEGARVKACDNVKH